MAVIVSMVYSKKLGLPQFSSHSCSLSVQVEVKDLSEVEQESQHLYALLQSSVDAEIQKVGFMPPITYGMEEKPNGIGNSTNGRNSANESTNGTNDPWACTEGQKHLILQLTHDHKLDKNEIEARAQQLFGLGVKQLNKMQASQVIDELLEKLGKKPNGSRWRGNNRQPSTGGQYDRRR
jgi:hypothetical protein